MVVALDNTVALSDAGVERLNGILEAVAAMEQDPEESYERKLATGAIKTFDGLYVFQRLLDEEGKYEQYLDQIIDSYNEMNEQVETSTGQTVNALYACVKLAALIAEEHCPNQDAVDQIEAALTQFGEDEDACVTFDDQMVNGARWLSKMLCAIAQLRSPDDDFMADVKARMESDTEDAEQVSDQTLELAVWLYSCVSMTAFIADTME